MFFENARKLNQNIEQLLIIMHGRIIFEKQKKRIRITGIAEDIAERKKAEEAPADKMSLERIISEASRRFLSLTELDQSINACLADIGRFCLAGRARLFQLTSDADNMSNTHEWCAPDVKPEIENLQGLSLDMFRCLMKLLAAGENIYVNNVSELPPEAEAEKEFLEDHNIRSVLVFPFLLENRPAGFLSIENIFAKKTWVDNEFVSLRTLAEIIGTAVTRKSAEEALWKSEEKLGAMLASLPEHISMMDKDLNIIWANDVAKRIFGEDIIGKKCYRAYHNRNKPCEPYPCITLKAFEDGRLRTHETQIVDKKGNTRDFCCTACVALRDKSGHPKNVIEISRDVTKRKRAEEEHEKIQAKLIQAQKMESIGTLAGGIAHNFNNILMGIQGRTSLMMINKRSTDPDYEHLRGIEKYVKNAMELTRELLGFARGGKYEVKATELNTLIKHENEMFGRTRREIRIHGKYEKDLWTVEVDQGQMQQVLLNLYVNAWQAMPGEGELYIKTENVTLDKQYTKPYIVAPGKYVKVSVIDTGVGMDAATRKKIFDPFFSTKDIGKGSGLGLASVYGIIKNHGGVINVYSEKGKGTTFNIYLPASEKKIAKERPVPKKCELQHGRGTIFIVDDEEMIIEVGRRMLEKLGYRVFTAGSGKEALDLYETQKEDVDLVILDMIMPDMGGGETYDRMKEIDENVKIILSSGYSIDGQAKEIMDRGCSGFIQKPFTMETLSRKVHKALDDGKA